MSNYISVSITIGIPSNLNWLDSFIDCIYKTGEVYTRTCNKSLNAPIKLAKEEARLYFEPYIQQLQASINFNDGPPSIIWKVDLIYYNVSMYARPGYLQWSMDLQFRKVHKDGYLLCADFEYYLRLLMDTMKDFPVLELSTDDDCIDDLEWLQVEGQWWRFTIQEAPRLYNFQLLDIIIFKTLTQDLINALTAKAAQCQFTLSLIHFTPLSTDVSSYEVASPLLFHYRRKDVFYEIQMVRLAHDASTRLLFRTNPTQHSAPLEQLVDHALLLTSDYILLKVTTFDTRYNYLDTETLL